MKPKKVREQQKKEDKFLGIVDSGHQYLYRLCNDSVNWKLVETYEHWAGNWHIKGVPHYLAFMEEFRGSHFVYCCGNDDLIMAKRGLSLLEAEELFSKIEMGTSKKELIELGIVYE